MEIIYIVFVFVFGYGDFFRLSANTTATTALLVNKEVSCSSIKSSINNNGGQFWSYLANVFTYCWIPIKSFSNLFKCSDIISHGEHPVSSVVNDRNSSLIFLILASTISRED